MMPTPSLFKLKCENLMMVVGLAMTMTPNNIRRCVVKTSCGSPPKLTDFFNFV